MGYAAGPGGADGFRSRGREKWIEEAFLKIYSSILTTDDYVGPRVALVLRGRTRASAGSDQFCSALPTSCLLVVGVRWFSLCGGAMAGRVQAQRGLPVVPLLFERKLQQGAP